MFDPFCNAIKFQLVFNHNKDFKNGSLKVVGNFKPKLQKMDSDKH